jgi:tRNA1Val (adenine37-N6)-methyltransferase
MKVGTDAMVLGSLAADLFTESPNRILDVGTGSGILALMMAQAYENSSVTGIEIESTCALEAEENARYSPFSKRVEIHHTSLQQYAEKQSINHFNFILSNPPYFVNSLQSTDVERNTARHTESLSFEELTKGVSSLLLENGKFMCILPSEAEDSILKEAGKKALTPLSITTIFHKANGASKRKVFVFQKTAILNSNEGKGDGCNRIQTDVILRSELVLFEADESGGQNSGQKRTEAYNRLSHMYYLR